MGIFKRLFAKKKKESAHKEDFWRPSGVTSDCPNCKVPRKMLCKMGPIEGKQALILKCSVCGTIKGAMMPR